MRLTARMLGLEPGPEVELPLRLAPGQSRAIYCFTELRGLNGRTVVHQWDWNGRSVQRKELPVGSPAWRTYSGTKITGDMPGQWRVAVIDAKTGLLIAETRFQVR